MITDDELNALRSQLDPPPEGTPLATLGEMNNLADKLSDLREAKRIAEEAVSNLSSQLDSLQQQLIDIMLENHIMTYKAPAGTLSVTHHFSARLPQGEDKAKFFSYLKSIGRFEEMASIHSQTFNSWVKEQYELAKENGEDEPALPGVTDVKTLLRISFRRAK